MPNELKDIKVQIISLVDKGANGATIIYKSASADPERLLKESARIILIAKTDDEKHMAYCIVYPVNKVDSQGDWATPKEVVKAMIAFMKASNTASVDTQHNRVLVDGVTIVENWIVKSGDPLFPDEVGAWAAGMFVENEEIWDKIKKGEITGFSIYGLAKRVPGEVPTEKSDSNLVKKIVAEIKKHFIIKEKIMEPDKDSNLIKDFNAELAEQNLCDYVYAFCDALFDILDDDTVTDRNAAMVQSATQFMSAIQNVSAVKREIAKAGKVLSDANYKKIQDAITFLKDVVSAADSATTSAKAEKLITKFKKEDSEMTNEEIKKQIDDAVKVAKEEIETKLTEANSKIEKLETENAEQKTKIETLENASKGSTQKHDVEDPKPVVKAFALPLGLRKPVID